MARPLLVLLALAMLAAPARAATGTGSFELRRAAVPAPAQRATWTIAGSVVPARAEARKLGITPDKTLIDTDTRYVHARLTSAHRDKQVDSCGDGMAGTTIQTYVGVASAPSAFQLELVLNQLHGRGTAHVGVADSPWPGGGTRSFASGRTHYASHSTCYGSVEDRTGIVDVVADDGMFAMFGIGRLYEHAWTLRRGRDGAWRLAGTHRFSQPGEKLAATAAVAFRGSATGLHAWCITPRKADLAHARTAAAAKAIMRRAGFPHARAGTRHTRAAGRGRFYAGDGVQDEGGQAYKCGSRLNVMRSLGWP
jgi:hypothetical protein